MKLKNTVRMLLTLGIFVCLTVSIYGQDTTENEVFAYDTTQVPYFFSEEFSFPDSLKKELENSLSTLLERREIVENGNTTFFLARQQRENYNELNRKAIAFDWSLVGFFLYLILLALLRLQIPAVFFLLQQILWGKKRRDLFKIDNPLRDFLHFSLIVCSWIGISLALMEGLSFFNFAFPFEPVFFSLTFTFCYFFLKYFLKRISDWAFQMDSISTQHMLFAVNANFVWALVAFPLIVVNHSFENKYLIGIVCVIAGINFLQKLISGWMLFSQKLKNFENLLYLCTLEVFPFLLFARYILNCFLV